MKQRQHGEAVNPGLILVARLQSGSSQPQGPPDRCRRDTLCRQELPASIRQEVTPLLAWIAWLPGPGALLERIVCAHRSVAWRRLVHDPDVESHRGKRSSAPHPPAPLHNRRRPAAIRCSGKLASALPQWPAPTPVSQHLGSRLLSPMRWPEVLALGPAPLRLSMASTTSTSARM